MISATAIKNKNIGILDQDGVRTASENACQKPAGNSRRLKKRGGLNKVHNELRINHRLMG